MKKIIKTFIRTTLSYFDIGITRYSRLKILENNYAANNEALRDIEILQHLSGNNSKEMLYYLPKSKSQLRQDLFVLSHLGFKKNGFFVEFGATNGLGLSNSHLMEKEFSWTGILAEPARCWHKELKKNRSCNIETDCVWKDSNSILSFNQVDIPELSTIVSFSNTDSHSEARKSGETYEVNTISLSDLLKKYNAPKNIDYLSIDTEGSEYQILSHFNFSEFNFKVITCEHNYTPMRQEIFSLLTQHGYVRVFEDLSLWDDWYIKLAQ